MHLKLSDLTESDLHQFWKTSRYFSHPLKSVEDHRIEVIRRGRHNTDGGPDFRDAVIRIDGRIRQGDVELHLQAKDWFTHGHHQDPAYNHVVLHVALDSGAVPPALFCENGLSVSQVLVPGDVLGVRAAEQETQQSLPIFDCPLSAAPRNKILATIQRAGELRFQQKVEALREQIQSVSWDQLLYTALCEGLGYSKNKAPFRKLAELLPIDLLFAELLRTRENPDVLISSLLLGAAGLLKPCAAHGAVDAEIQSFLTPRREIWRRYQHVLQLKPLSEAAWQFFRLRPQNFPTRRLAALAELVLRFYRTGMIESLLSLLAAPRRSLKRKIAELRRLFLVPAQGFWQRHYDFRSAKSPATVKGLGHLLGTARADDLIVNVVLPVLSLYAEEVTDAAVGNRVRELYAGFPGLQENVITKAMRRQLGLPRQGSGAVRTMACLQQGLIGLAQNYCRPLACEACMQLTENG